MKIVTSAIERAEREPEPAKITSSMPVPRIDLALFSPIAQRSASSRFDLPQPFGPTMPVRPGSTWTSVGSTNDLKPDIRIREIFNETYPISSAWGFSVVRSPPRYFVWPWPRSYLGCFSLNFVSNSA